MGFGFGLGRGYGKGYGRGYGRGRGYGSGGFSGYTCVKFVFFIFNVLFWVSSQTIQFCVYNVKVLVHMYMTSYISLLGWQNLSDSFTMTQDRPLLA